MSNNPAYSDHNRPLSDEGRSLAKQTAELLSEWSVDQIICSSATRTIETANLLSGHMGKTTQPTSSQDLYLGAPKDYLSAAAELAESDSDNVLIVGHNPGIASLICSWANDHLSIPPATVAVFRLPLDDWSQLTKKTDTLTKELAGFVSSGVRVR